MNVDSLLTKTLGVSDYIAQEYSQNLLEIDINVYLQDGVQDFVKFK